MSRSSMLSTQRVALLVGSILCLVVFYELRTTFGTGLPLPIFSDKAISDGATPSSSSEVIPEKHDDPCASLRGLEDIAIVLKTGASEIYEKLPIHFATTFACTSDYLIYSDLEQGFGVAQVRDALKLVSPGLREQSSEFEQYRLLQERANSGGNAAELKGEKSWMLDKYKFLPMITDAWRTFGNRKKWYVFIEADTYISMHNLLLWLQNLNEKQGVYAGAQVLIGSTEFAHGGSGFLLSAPAAEALSHVYTSQQQLWEEKLLRECCGDKLMAEVLLNASPSIGVLRSFPIVQGETPASLDWSPIHWCMPAVSWHHVDAAMVDQIWRFEMDWRAEHGADKPLIFRDYFDAFVRPRLIAADWKMQVWDNLSNDWTFNAVAGEDATGKPYSSVAACERFCVDQESCVQWAWRPGQCRGGKVIKLGWALNNRPQLGSADNRIVKLDGVGDEFAVSGWLQDKIQNYITRQEPCDQKTRWITRNG